jgi:hypothetical protein
MLNMIDTQDKLKNFSEDQLVREMQMPSGSAPQFMVLGEIERRKRMRADAQKQQGLMQPTVAQEAVSAAGVPQQGIAQIARSLAPKTDMAQNTGVPNVQAAGLPAQPNQPQRMAGGGIMRLAPGGQLSGGTMTAVASLKVNYPDLYEQYKDNPAELAQVAQAALEVAEDPGMTTLEELEAPQTSGQRRTDAFKSLLSKLPPRWNKYEREKMANQKQDIREHVARFGSLNAIGSYGDDDPIFAEGSPEERIRTRTSRDEAVTPAVTPEYTTLESLEVPRIEAYRDIRRGSIAREGNPDPVDLRFISPAPFAFMQPLSDAAVDSWYDRQAKNIAAGYDKDYDWDQRYQSKRNLSTYDDDDPIFGDGVGDDATRARKFKAVEDAAAVEEAKRAYLAGGGVYRLPESGVSAVVDMLNRGREFQQSDTYTEPGDIYPIGGNSARGTLKYSLTPDEQGTQFDDLAGEAARKAARAARDEARRDVFERRGLSPAGIDEARLDVFERRGSPPAGRDEARPADTETFQDMSDSYAAQEMAAYNKAQLAATAAREADREAEERLDVFERRGLPITPTEARLRREAGEAVDVGTAGIAGVEVKTPDEGTIRPKSRPEGLGALTKPATKVGSTSAATKVGSTSAAAAKIGEKLSPREKQVNQDKWLALAQAGFTLMNTGDFGEAGSAGLAALRNSKQADLEERKVAASEALTAAKIATAGRKGGIKAPTASALTFYQKQVENAEAALKRVTQSGTQVEKNDAMRELTRAQGALRQLTERYGNSQGLRFEGGSSSGRESRDVTSKVG